MTQIIEYPVKLDNPLRESPIPEHHVPSPERADIDELTSYVSYHQNGKIFEKGDLWMGMRSGRWVTYGEDGEIKEDGEYALDKREGKWMFWTPRYYIEAEFSNDLRNGKETILDKHTSDVYTSYFLDGMKHGIFSQVSPKGKQKAIYHFDRLLTFSDDSGSD